MDSEIGHFPLSKRDADETDFFAEGIWKQLPAHVLGIQELRGRLSNVLLRQIATELPSVISEIETKHKSCEDRLKKLGQPRTTTDEQRLYLVQISQSFQILVKASVDGTYNDPFFVDAHTERGYQQRIRAVLQNLNRDFASVLIERGHSHQIVADSDEILDEQEDDGVRPVAIKRSAFVERIKELIHLTRGRELPGTFSPMIVTNLFMEQCHKWDVMTDKHVSDVWVAAQAFIKLVAARVADAAASKPLLEEIIEPAMKKLWTTLMVKKCELLKPHKSGHPITYNDDFSKALQKLRDDRRRTEVIDALLTCFDISSKMATDSQGYLEEGDYNFKKLVASLVKPSEPDMDRLAASEALDCMEAYYEVALKRFMDDVAIELVETKLIAALGDIFSPVRVFSMPSVLVEQVAGESEENQRQREQLQQQLDVLNKGAEFCKRFVGVRLGNSSDSKRAKVTFDRWA